MIILAAWQQVAIHNTLKLIQKNNDILSNV